MKRFKLGRLPRKHDPRVPHWSAVRLVPSIALPTPPVSIDYTTKIPSIGMLGNDEWGCCAEAGAYHLLQLWQWNALGTMPNAGTAQALQLYSEVTGFDANAGPPGNNPTDQGTALQDLLAYWLKSGIPLADGNRHKILAYFEVDPRSVADLDLGTAESAGLYMGFNVPAWLEQQEAPGSVWGAPPPGANASIVGGHCVVSGGYTAQQRREIESWGETTYAMEPAFWADYVDEVYVVISPDFVRADGKTPYGVPLSVWDQHMCAIKEAA